MNKTLWTYYKNSEDGQKAIDLFNPEPNDVYQEIEDIAEFLKIWDGHLNPQQLINSVFIYEINFSERNLFKEEVFSRSTFEELIKSYDLQEFDLKDNQVIWIDEKYFIQSDKFRQKAASIDAFSIYLYFLDSYFPMKLSDQS